jgi:Fe-S cluster biosynthesis and repair protein YggX
MRKSTLAILILVFAPFVFAETPDTTPLTANQVVAKMVLHNLQRETRLGGYRGMRLYVLDNKRFHKHAEMLVQTTCNPDGSKHFHILSEEGWSAANNHVFRKMLASEERLSLSSGQDRTRLDESNYRFRMIGTETLNGRRTYVLEVVPRRKDQFLVKGRIWVDANEYALVRVEGEPGKRPSFWVRKTDVTQTYEQQGRFWFAARTQSVNRVLFFGQTDVTIFYFDYEQGLVKPVSPEVSELVTEP